MHWTAERDAGLARLEEFAPHAGKRYTSERNFDDGYVAGKPRRNVSQLSPWLHAGLLSEREVLAATLAKHSPSAAEKFIAEVFWRVYFKGYLEQRPTIWPSYCASRDAAFEELAATPAKAKAYESACAGATGIEAFDHWARELVQTGYLHNHARMWFASIWIFTLKLNWELGADFFLRHLIDGDAASNTLSWRWVGGLHTKGKTYLARPDNIARYTERMADGPLSAEGLSRDAEPLEEATEHCRTNLDLPGPSDLFAHVELSEPYALMLHDEAAHHSALDLYNGQGSATSPALVIGTARPEARSPEPVGDLARDFAHRAVASGMAEAAQAFGCEARELRAEDDLSAILDEAGLQRLVVPYLPVGWTKDALMPQLEPLIAQGRVTTVLNDLNRSTWPQARAGFFKVKKAIPTVLRELGIT